MAGKHLLSTVGIFDLEKSLKIVARPMKKVNSGNRVLIGRYLNVCGLTRTLGPIVEETAMFFR